MHNHSLTSPAESPLTTPDTSPSSWQSMTLKTLGVIAISTSIYTVNGLLMQISAEKRSVGPFGRYQVDWNSAIDFLLNTGLINLLSLPLIIYAVCLVTFIAARLQKGQGGFWEHSYMMSIGYLKCLVVGLSISALSAVWPSLQWLNVILLFIFAQVLSEAIRTTHQFSMMKAVISLFATLLVGIMMAVMVIAMLLILDPLLTKTLPTIMEGLQ